MLLYISNVICTAAVDTNDLLVGNFDSLRTPTRTRKKINACRQYSLILCLFILLSGCSTDTPEKYFDVAVLNINMFFGFADDGLLRELESPSVKLSENNSEPVPMKRSEVINMKIQQIENNFDKLQKLNETEETKDMLTSSLNLYKYVLPVYKNEYVQLAELFDRNASVDQIQSLSNSIHNKYYNVFSELYNKLINAGKIYADKNAIKVNWGVY